MPDPLGLESREASSSGRETSVAFQRPDFAVFRFNKPEGTGNSLKVAIARIPTFIVRGESGAFRWWGSLKAACARVKLSPALPGSHAFRGLSLKGGYFRGRSWTMSVAFHAAAILLIVYVHQQLPESVSAFDEPVSQPEVIYYRVPVRQLPKTLPHITPPGPGGHPLLGRLPTQATAAGSTTAQSVLTIVSKPAHPDNSHQTIIQPSSPPDLKITTDVKLPNIILGKPLEAPKAPLQFNPTTARPTQRERPSNSDAAPSLSAENSANPVMTFLTPPAFKPSMPVPVASGTAQRKSTSGTGNVQAPNVTATSGESLTLAVISTDPAGLVNPSEIMLPPGNRSGEFSTSVTDNLVGSPGANRAGVVGGGPGNTGKGGDGSTGPGAASSGGGGISASEGPVAINGAGTNSIGSGMLGAALARGIVYPVPAAFNIRRNSLIVSAGPIGGGGLDAYGALHCGKIYTIFLPMPGKNWTMQYCAQGGSEAAAAESPTVARFGEGVVPPQADSKFDFQRLGSSPGESWKDDYIKGVATGRWPDRPIGSLPGGITGNG